MLAAKKSRHSGWSEQRPPSPPSGRWRPPHIRHPPLPSEHHHGPLSAGRPPRRWLEIATLRCWNSGSDRQEWISPDDMNRNSNTFRGLWRPIQHRRRRESWRDVGAVAKRRWTTASAAAATAAALAQRLSGVGRSAMATIRVLGRDRLRKHPGRPTDLDVPPAHGRRPAADGRAAPTL